MSNSLKVKPFRLRMTLGYFVALLLLRLRLVTRLDYN